MTFASALYGHLTADAPIAELVDSRIFPVVGPPPESTPGESYPNTLIFRLEGISPVPSITWSIQETTRWGLIALSVDHGTAHAIAAAVKNCLHAFQGPIGGPAGFLVQSAMLIEARDEYDPEYSIFAVETVYEFVYHPLT